MLTVSMELSFSESVAVALACAAECDSYAARALTWLQAPVGGARPTVGLVLGIARRFGEPAALTRLAAGPARSSGLLRLDDEHDVMADASLRVPAPIVLALADADILQWPGLPWADDTPAPLGSGARQAAAAWALALQGGACRALAVRSAHPQEARNAAAEVAGCLHARALFVEGAVPAGLGPWLRLAGAVPVLCRELAPGERLTIPAVPGWPGPVLLAAGPEGSFEREGDPVPDWAVPVPAPAERAALWALALGDAALADGLAQRHRCTAGRIAALGRAGWLEARRGGCEQVTLRHVAAATRKGWSLDLGGLAATVAGDVHDDAMVLPQPLRDELQALVRRCQARGQLSERLGPALQARWRNGLCALFVGPSGTGKSLAAAWLATRLALPLYRVDLAALTSKYIGETEKNLARLFARAEHGEVVLLFDEADALFGKRTDVKDSNDRYANGQTNYLLQRIESFEGIAILTSNSRTRFDSAFARRLDTVVEFPMPRPEERRALWLAHLGTAHGLSTQELNRLAAMCELAGGHIRNAVLHAAAQADADAPIGFAGLANGLLAEYAKLGRQLPAALQPVAAER
jgi:hypothetical protein